MTELLFFSIAIFLYGSINFYLYVRVQVAFASWFPGVAPAVFALVFWFFAGLFIIAQLFRHLTGYNLPVFLIKISDYWLAVLFYSVLLVAAIDLLRLTDRFFHWIPAFLKEPQLVSLVILFLVLLIVSGGAWNARHPRVTSYDLTVNKQPGNVQDLHVVMVSDLHLGVIVDKERLAYMVKAINDLQPDLVLMPGDIIDGDLQIFVRENMGEELRKIQSRYGVYACLGNHEYYSGPIEEVDYYLRQAGVQLLRDQVVMIDDSFYLAGRTMGSENPADRNRRPSLQSMLQGLDHGKPMLVMDHVPSRLEEAAGAGVDLLLCGHTHLGQLWPLNYITRQVFLSDYGHYYQEPFQAVISNGVGTWGPPIRVGNSPEIVDMVIKFAY